MKNTVPVKVKKSLFYRIGRLIDGIDEVIYDAGEVAIKFPRTVLVTLAGINADINMLRNVYDFTRGEWPHIIDNLQNLTNFIRNYN
jgi:hypothetical protein